MVRVISTTITEELANKAEAHQIKWSEALRVGIGVILAERGDDAYTGGINVYRKINKLAEILEETQNQLEQVKRGQR